MERDRAGIVASSSRAGGSSCHRPRARSREDIDLANPDLRSRCPGVASSRRSAARPAGPAERSGGRSPFRANRASGGGAGRPSCPAMGGVRRPRLLPRSTGSGDPAASCDRRARRPRPAAIGGQRPAPARSAGQRPAPSAIGGVRRPAPSAIGGARRPRPAAISMDGSGDPPSRDRRGQETSGACAAIGGVRRPAPGAIGGSMFPFSSRHRQPNAAGPLGRPLPVRGDSRSPRRRRLDRRAFGAVGEIRRVPGRSPRCPGLLQPVSPSMRTVESVGGDRRNLVQYLTKRRARSPRCLQTRAGFRACLAPTPDIDRVRRTNPPVPRTRAGR